MPTAFDFGRVTSGNTSAPLEVTIRNTGNAALTVSGVGVAGGPFSANLSGGARPCGSAPATVAPNDSCTFRVSFQPTGNGSFTGTIQVASSDSRSPTVSVPISGTSEGITALTVHVNQVETACPSNAATAYVSVLDQGRFPVVGLNTGNFRLTEGSPPSANLLLNAVHVGAAYRPLAISAVLDHSSSITDQTVAFNDMKNGFAAFFGQMRGNDVGELIAFGTVFEVRVPFPTPSDTGNASNKAALINGLAAPWTKGPDTLLYDSVYRAIEDTAPQTSYRRAVIVATDGVDQGPSSGTLSTRTLNDVIALAVSRRVPVFTIGIGSQVNASVLQDMAAGTGGVFYQAGTSQNLATIYQQLSSLLFENQYVLTFDQQPLGVGTIAPLQVNATSSNGAAGSGTGSIRSCN